jgi:hypothetical protein
MKPVRAFNFKLWSIIYHLFMQYFPKKTDKELSLKIRKFLILIKFFFQLTTAKNTRF